MRKISLRIRKAAEDLGVKRIVFGECGHAWRVAYSFLNTLAGPFRLPRPALSDPAAHLRIHLRPHRAGQAQVRQVEERSHPADVPRFMQRRARLAHGRQAGRAVRDPARDPARELQPLLRHGAGDHQRKHVLLRRRRRASDRRADGPAQEGRAAAHAGACSRSPTSTASRTWPPSARSARRSSRRCCRCTASTWKRSSSVHQMVSNAIVLIGVEGGSEKSEGNEE